MSTDFELDVMVQAVHLMIHGRVQGVYFRDSAVQQAARLGVRGWVRNRSDGSLEVLVWGEPGAVGDFVRWARQGPSGAHVERLEVELAEPDLGWQGFVRRQTL